MSDNKNGAKMESRKTCSVALKSPNGLILRLFTKVTKVEPTMAGTREYEQYEPNLNAGTITLRGYKGAAFGIRQPYRIAGGYAITNNVSLDFIEEWLKQNKEHDVVKNKLIFVGANEDEAAAKAIEGKDVWDGLNPLRMPRGETERKSKDPRVPKRVGLADKSGDNADEDEVMRRPESLKPEAA